MVDRNSSCCRRSRRLWRIRHATRFRREILRMGTVPLAFLLAPDRPAPTLVAPFSCIAHPSRPFRVPCHMLLLSQSLLPRFLSRSPRLRSRRIPSSQLSRRNRFPLYLAKCPPLFFLSRGSFHHFPLVRRGPLLLLRRPLWYRRRHARPHSQHLSPFALHLFLPLAPSSRRS